MAVTVKNDDLVLKYKLENKDTISLINKYDLFLDTLSCGDYIFQKVLIRDTLKFVLSENYKNISDLARENFINNSKIQSLFNNIDDYLKKFQMGEKKSCTIDSATGTGKSYILYGLAVIMLCEGVVDKVLVLCPSLTIEEELTEKFRALNSNNELHSILKEVNPLYCVPEIVNANSSVLSNQICIENIHSTYERTGSSIEDSFKLNGERVLVLNDEAHHIFSGEADSNTKKWLDFLLDEEYCFKYIINLTGTPYYIGTDEYFYDVVSRFSIKEAVDRNVVKKIDYKTGEDYKEDKGFEDSYAVHEQNKEAYGQYIKPLSIIVTEKILTSIQVSIELVKFLVEKEGISEEEASKKVIWVASSLPTNKKEKAIVTDLIPNAEKTRKDNLQLLKDVDDNNNTVEWIISVAMLTEGWDVKNVFQIIPHERRAFESKLLISQVLGRGLRIPQVLKNNKVDCYLKVNNHEKWTTTINKLYDDILEIENKLSWGYDDNREIYNFNLYNIKYEPIEEFLDVTDENKTFNGNFGFISQSKSITGTDEYKYGNKIVYTIEEKETYEIEEVVKLLYAYLKQKDSNIVKEWSKKKIRETIVLELSNKGQDTTFLSKANYINAQKAFEALFIEKGKKVPRVSLKYDNIEEIKISDMKKQSFSEDSLKNIGALFYTETTKKWFDGEQEELFINFTEPDKKIISITDEIRKKIEANDTIDKETLELQKIQNLKNELNDHMFNKIEQEFKCPLNLLYVTYEPEILFVKSLFNNIDLIDSFIKSPDKGFYSLPYSYKPHSMSKTHVHHELFNPDFFIKVGTDIIVVEIKKDGDDSNKNKAKLKDGLSHFNLLNEELELKEEEDRYYFKFLSSENNDYLNFWQAIRENRYKEWMSTLMIKLNQ